MVGPDQRLGVASLTANFPLVWFGGQPLNWSFEPWWQFGQGCSNTYHSPAPFLNHWQHQPNVSHCGLEEAKTSFLRHKMFYWGGAAAILHSAFGQGVSPLHCSCRCPGKCRVSPPSPGSHHWMGRGLWETGGAVGCRRGWRWDCPHIRATDAITRFRLSNLCLKGNSVNQQQGGQKLSAQTPSMPHVLILSAVGPPNGLWCRRHVKNGNKCKSLLKISSSWRGMDTLPALHLFSVVISLQTVTRCQCFQILLLWLSKQPLHTAWLTFNGIKFIHKIEP